MKKLGSGNVNMLDRIFQEMKKEGNLPISFRDFQRQIKNKPHIVIRDIFQRFCEMIRSYLGEGIDEYPDDPESINYRRYCTESLFVEGVDDPFFADRIFTNRLVNLVASMERGIRQNKVYIFEGSHGSGKSTFLNDLLLKFEKYSNTEEGAAYQVLWKIKTEGNSVLEVPCPSHDHPLLLVPKEYRKQLLEDLIEDDDFKEKLFSEKRYEWVFKKQPCSICLSLSQALLDKGLVEPGGIFDMIYVRRYHFNRRLGQGISVYNPGDLIPESNVMSNAVIQKALDEMFKESGRVKYIFSTFARTNEGIYAIMDVKEANITRLSGLHGILSEGVHRVEEVEENVQSLFIALANPEDLKLGKADENKQKAKSVRISQALSFKDRMEIIKVPYALVYRTEVDILKNVYGNEIESHFLPRVLDNFAKIVISTRLNPESHALTEWIQDPAFYIEHCDKKLLLLKEAIYAGEIPNWLTKEDRKNFTAKCRMKIIAESEEEGDRGFSGRDSQKIFGEFYLTYARNGNLITMAMVEKFFKKHQEEKGDVRVSEAFLRSIIMLYNYNVLQEVKEALYSYNERKIADDIQNYLHAINFDIGMTVDCPYTGQKLEVSESFFAELEEKFFGRDLDLADRMAMREELQNRFTVVATQQMQVEGKNLTETDIYKDLYEEYVQSLKEHTLDPFVRNNNFRSAIKDYGTETFSKSYDRRIQQEVTLLMKNLVEKFHYSDRGAKEICVYVIDNDLAQQLH
jgi:hypothetical protein